MDQSDACCKPLETEVVLARANGCAKCRRNKLVISVQTAFNLAFLVLFIVIFVQVANLRTDVEKLQSSASAQQRPGGRSGLLYDSSANNIRRKNFSQPPENSVDDSAVKPTLGYDQSRTSAKTKPPLTKIEILDVPVPNEIDGDSVSKVCC